MVTVVKFMSVEVVGAASWSTLLVPTPAATTARAMGGGMVTIDDREGLPRLIILMTIN